MAPSATISDKKIAKTYGKKTINPVNQVERLSSLDDDNGKSTLISPQSIQRPDIFKQVSEKLKQVELQLATTGAITQVQDPVKSRKSDIRPRKSIAPSQLEFDALLACCNQKEAQSFEEWLKASTCDYPLVEKIGESSFSEVFKLGHSTNDMAMAVKILPILRPGSEAIQVNGNIPDPMPIPVAHLLHEVEALQALESLRTERRYSVPSGHTGFNRLVHCGLVSGPFPESLISIWDEWKSQHETFNDRPDFYHADSLHVIITMEYGGRALEDYPIESVEQIHSILCQVLAAMALAEEKIHFEHRDLHLGNVLLRPTNRNDLRPSAYQTIPTGGVLCNIIDCSLARYDGNRGLALWRDLAKEDWLFNGDAQTSRQYEIYRQMRDLVGLDWEKFHSETNLLWIKFIGEELLEKNAKRLAKKQKTKYNLLFTAVKQFCAYDNCKLALRGFLDLFLEKNK